jgi:Putative Ig domain/Family of unknown function (DUF6519)
MVRAVSRESFDELKNYLGVYQQQGRVILDADWNENQDIAVSFVRRLGREALGEGSPNRGFAIDPIFPPPPLILSSVDTTGMDLQQAIGAILGACLADLLSLMLYLIFGPLLFFLNFPGQKLEDFEALDGFALSSPQGRLRIGRDRPYAGRGFLRLSGHPGTVTITRTLDNLVDLSSFELATFRFRLNHQAPGTLKLFLEDDAGNRSVWLNGNPAFGADLWLAGFAAPLDLSFRIVTPRLAAAVVNESYSAELSAFAGTTPMTWTISAGALPAGLSIAPTGTGDESRTGRISGTPSAAGTFSFTVQVTDAGGAKATRAYTQEVKASGEQGLQLPTASEMLARLGKWETPTGQPADLTQIRRYGFEVYQDTANPLVWDLDDLRLASSALELDMGANNFIIRGSEFSQFLNTLTLLSVLQSADLDEDGGDGDDDDILQNILDILNTDFQLAEPSIENAGRLYVAGLPCVAIKDTLYSHQADPNDPPLTPPPAGEVRKDTVYLDVWTEPATYIDDPEIREIALGGPDTTTRLRVRHRVRVAQGGELPRGTGVGDGTLATEGSYTAQANRLYRVEIDTAGDVGTATFRWSEDNASTIQRVIATIPPGSTRVVVEDAASFHPGDQILLRKEFGAEQHEIAAVFANTITLKEPTGAQLALLPAAGRVADFTTFALDDRPMVQRWNAFKVLIEPDPSDPTIARAIGLNDGVHVLFGGHGLRRGDYWNFRTRYLAGDEASGIDPDTRIERLDFQRARGVVHHFASLATITRDGSADEPDKIFLIQDRRQRVGNASSSSGPLANLTGLTGTAPAHLGGLALPPAGRDSKFVILWSGDLFLPALPPTNSTLTIRVGFYNDQMTDPATEPDQGKIQDREATVQLRRKPTGIEVPLQLVMAKSDTPFLFLPIGFVPTSVQLFAELNQTGFSIELVNMTVTALELKKAY